MFCRKVGFTDDIALDFAAGERPVGVEILGASHLVERPEKPTVELTKLLLKVASA